MFKKLMLTCLLFIPIMGLAQPASDIQLATHYYQSGEFDKAILYYEKIYSQNPTKIYYTTLLKSYLAVKDYKQAEKLVKQRIKSNPELAYIVDLGHIYEEQEESKKANQTYDKAIKSIPSDASEVIKLSKAFQSYNNNEYALRTYEKGRKESKGKYPFNIEIAELYEKQGKYELMIKEYLDLLSVNEAYMQSIQSSLENANALDKSSKQFQILRNELVKNVQKNPNKMVYSEMLTWLYLQINDFDMALIQTKAIDKRNKEEGERVIKLAQAAYNNKAYNASIKAYEYVITKGDESPYYYMAKTQQLSAYRDKLTFTNSFEKEDVIQLEKKYKLALNEVKIPKLQVELLKNLASLQALYLNQIDSAITTINKAIGYRNVSKNLLAECKIDLADYLVLKNEVWDASLYYSQVEKDYKYDEIGERAKFKNAKISYYTGDFKWAKAQLDVLKGSTSKLIANDALWLSVLITDNTTADTNETPMRIFAEAELLILQNRFNEALILFDSIQKIFPAHSLDDDILFQKHKINVKEQKYDQAIKELNQIITKYSDGLLADNALFTLAEIYENEKQDVEKAKELYLQLMKEYPGSLRNVEAKKRFRALRGEQLN